MIIYILVYIYIYHLYCPQGKKSRPIPTYGVTALLASSEVISSLAVKPGVGVLSMPAISEVVICCACMIPPAPSCKGSHVNGHSETGSKNTPE